MKEIKAYIRREKADVIIRNLEIAGVKGMTVIDVYALCEWADQESYSYSVEFVEKYSKVIKLEIVCDDEDADKLAEIIAKYGYTGDSGDGIIFISPIEKSIKIRTKETNVI